MAKSKKQTPQEAYQERKAREEAERNAYLPPGLINHGNTCFMNSTLQGLLATRFLDELVHFEPLPAQVQTYSPIHIESWRSPLLTNGHGLGGNHEQEWVDGMPLGDAFLRIMLRAWTVQEHRKRECMSPKDVLNAIGRKYDQYFDFAQQDAHEFLRQLLDAMRMEELDIIKKRQPRPPNKEKRSRGRHSLPGSRSTSPTPARPPGFTSPLSVVREASSSEGAPVPLDIAPNDYEPPGDEEKLATFPDMLFGGSLASILVCEKCKKISITHEDFNDLSLSIRPEDYGRGNGPSARNKLKNLAKKLKIPRTSHLERADSPTHAVQSPPIPSIQPPLVEPKILEIIRSASVPPSPMRRSSDFQAGGDAGLLVAHSEPRRRSIDAPITPSALRSTLAAAIDGRISPSGARSSALEGSALADDNDTVVSPPEAAADEQEQEQRGRVGFIEPGEKPARSNTKSGKDNWAKFSRRISAAMGRASPAASRSKERGRSRRNSTDFAQPRDVAAPSPEPGLASSTTIIPSVEEGKQRPDASLTHILAAPAIVLQQPTPVVAVRSPPLGISNPREKSPRPPKPTREEAAYLQALLADVAIPSSNPFTAFLSSSSGQHSHLGSGAGMTGDSQSRGQAIWAGLKLTQLTNVEECLRMFTAIEVLDGENRVGCRRCWKIANGVYRPRRSAMPEEDGEDEDGSDGNEKDDTALGLVAKVQEERLATSHPLSSPISSDTSTFASSTASIARSTSTANGDHHAGQDSLSTSVSSLASDSVSGGVCRELLSPIESGATTKRSTLSQKYQGLPIPSISTTAPSGSHNSSDQMITSAGSSLNGDSLRTPPYVTPNAGRDSLVPPQTTRSRGHTNNDTDDSDVESDAGSVNSWTRSGGGSDISSNFGSPAASPRSSREALPLILAAGNAANANRPSIDRLLSTTPPRSLSPLKAVPRSQQKIMRRALKRYLIFIPPPVLVIHLKRFQQIGNKVSAISFTGSSFKKLEDYVAFPEYLDLGPYLAPKKEDFGLIPGAIKQKKVLHARKKDTVCMYRLYAVVEHIGNMLGGHYVAYTALPIGPTSASHVSTPASEKTSVPALDNESTSKTHVNGQAPKSRQWAYISDTVVKLTTLDEVMKAKAYMCLYERI